jgi:hypothetical protein
MDASAHGKVRLAGFVVLTIIYIAGAYIYGQHHNPSYVDSDQNAYLNEIRELRDTHYSRITQRSRMPLYLYLQSLLARKGMTSAKLFPRAKLVNLFVSAVGLLAIYVIASRFLPRIAAENLLLITAFTVFIFRAAYVYAELLYYILFFLAFLLLLRLFFRPNCYLAAIAGVALALAHLTKASTLPALIIFFVIYIGSALLVRTRIPRSLAICAIVLITYLAALSPYLIHSKQAFGHYFYNVNTTLYLWCDSWLEVCNGPKAHGDRRHWPTMPPDQVPSFPKYIHDHGLWHIPVMTAIGAKKLLAEAWNSSGFTKYLVLYGVFTTWLIATSRAPFRQWLSRRENAGAAAFLLTCCAAYFLAISFYVKITQPGMRFMLAMFLPAMFGMSYLMSREPMKSASVRVGKWNVDAAAFQHFIRCLFVANLLVSIIPRLLMGRH